MATKKSKNTFNELEKNIVKFSHEISIIIEKLLVKEDISLIYKSDGRHKNACECCKHGSYIYFLYNKSDELIYLGESGQSVKHRLFTDGSGSHCKKKWFKEVSYVKYYKNSNMDYKTRKALERLLIKKYDPIYNDQNHKKINQQ